MYVIRLYFRLYLHVIVLIASTNVVKMYFCLTAELALVIISGFYMKKRMIKL